MKKPAPAIKSNLASDQEIPRKLLFRFFSIKASEVDAFWYASRSAPKAIFDKSLGVRERGKVFVEVGRRALSPAMERGREEEVVRRREKGDLRREKKKKKF